MITKPKQLDRVLFKMNRDGFITRNECLAVRPAITRLGAIIHALKKEGYKIKGKDYKNDYVYEFIHERRSN